MTATLPDVADLLSRYSIEELLEIGRSLTDPRERLAFTRVIVEAIGADPRKWLTVLYPNHVKAGFAPHHETFWRWVWGLQRGVRPRPFFGVWARGGAKSSSAELSVVAAGARQSRKYVLYVCRTQDRADDHVGNIGGMLSSSLLELLYPELARRSVGKYGSSRGWRRNRLITASGLVVDAIGLDTAARGAKIDEDRPDWVILDDVDDQHDSLGIVAKTVRTIGRSILLAGTNDLAVLGIQNLIHPDGVFAQVIDGRAELLTDRIVSGPIPALEGDWAIEAQDVDDWDDPNAIPWRIIGEPRPTWEGQDVAACERLLALVGPTNFRVECQHETGLAVQGMFADIMESIVHVHRDDVPDLVRKTICVDPATTDTDNSDAQGIQCDGIDKKGTIYRLRSFERRCAPGTALETAIEWAYEEDVDRVFIEMNVGADMSGRSIEQSWVVAFNNALERVLERNPQWADRRKPKCDKLFASSSTGSKASRASRMHTDYEAKGKIVHVIGDHLILEAALARAFEVKPFDLCDAAYWSWSRLRRRRKAVGVGPATIERMGMPAGLGSHSPEGSAW